MNPSGVFSCSLLTNRQPRALSCMLASVLHAASSWSSSATGERRCGGELLRDVQSCVCFKRSVSSVRAPRAQDRGNQFDPESLFLSNIARANTCSRMVVPREICNAAANGERDRVLAWLDAGGSINDVDESGYTLVHCCVYGVCEHEQDRSINDQHVALARHLIALGADVNIATADSTTPLHNAVINDFSGQGSSGEYLTIDMLSVLLAAKPNVNARDPITNERPLGARLRIGASVHLLHRLTLSRTARMVRMLLRAGASLDSCGPHYGEDGTAEDILERRESLESSVGLAGNEHWIEIKTLIHGVRQHGSYKRYARSFHRDVLTVRGLAQRGKLSTSDPVLNFLARLGDNGVVWHVLSFWRATN